MTETSRSPDDLISVAEAADVLKVSPQRIRTLLRTGELGGRRIGRTWGIAANDVRRSALERGTLVMPKSHPEEQLDKEKMKVLSFFSGAMGLDLGLEKAGLETVLACEFDRTCRQTIQYNRPDLPLLGDIWQYSAADIRAIAGLGANEEIDVVAGGPPCQAFSTAGARRGFEDIRGNVFLHFIDLISELNPKYAVLENVRGLLSAALKHRPHNQRGPEFPPLSEEEKPGGALAYVVQKLREAGYSVSFNLYNAANYGSAQVRERVILICTRDGERVPFLSPTNSNDTSFGLPRWKTFRESVEGLDENDLNHLEFPENRLRYYKLLGPGQYWKHLPEELQKEAMGNSYFSGGGKTGFFRRLAWDKPSPTLVTHPTMPATDLAHPVENRPLSVEEYKRLQDFPDDWILQGNLVSQYKQLGNAVPLKLGEAIGKALLNHNAGISWTEPSGFPYSRYKRTSDKDILLAPTDSRTLTKV
ncbi:DNA cytosine methyltransferase [Arthrobacter crystallopoietes]|uniref:DNA cytosine methyltransferase n=1 Tax=Crystallibacter crystallopoietes TaxID=37928 RepID=UPI001ABE0B18|nr:DNA cytosine methyltransferase [Arthrobacter crystallopoietes]QTG82585.1 DNA cytosine methyltransferase [Arthrobacter crystallopoietes]